MFKAMMLPAIIIIIAVTIRIPHLVVVIVIVSAPSIVRSRERGGRDPVSNMM